MTEAVVLGDVVITTEDVWRAAVEEILDRIELTAPEATADLRKLLANPPPRAIL